MKIRALWDITPCILVGVDRQNTPLKRRPTLHIPDNGGCAHIWNVYSNETTRRYIPEASGLHNCRRENLKSRITNGS
jgi:hypothetical protein